MNLYQKAIPAPFHQGLKTKACQKDISANESRSSNKNDALSSLIMIMLALDML